MEWSPSLNNNSAETRIQAALQTTMIAAVVVAVAAVTTVGLMVGQVAPPQCQLLSNSRSRSSQALANHSHLRLLRRPLVSLQVLLSPAHLVVSLNPAHVEQYRKRRRRKRRRLRSRQVLHLLRQCLPHLVSLEALEWGLGSHRQAKVPKLHLKRQEDLQWEEVQAEWDQVSLDRNQQEGLVWVLVRLDLKDNQLWAQNHLHCKDNQECSQDLDLWLEFFHQECSQDLALDQEAWGLAWDHLAQDQEVWNLEWNLAWDLAQDQEAWNLEWNLVWDLAWDLAWGLAWDLAQNQEAWDLVQDQAECCQDQDQGECNLDKDHWLDFCRNCQEWDLAQNQEAWDLVQDQVECHQVKDHYLDSLAQGLKVWGLNAWVKNRAQEV